MTNRKTALRPAAEVPIDLQLEWHVLAALRAGHVPFESAPLGLFTAERKLTHARLRAGTVAEWEVATFDLLPDVSGADIAQQIERLAELEKRRRLLAAMACAEGGMCGDAMTADEACEILARAING